MKRLVMSAPRQEAEITGFKSELTKKTQSLSAVWDKFASRLAEREKALRLAASFYDRVTKVRRGVARGDPPNNGCVGTGHFVLYREIVLSSEVKKQKGHKSVSFIERFFYYILCLECPLSDVLLYPLYTVV